MNIKKRVRMNLRVIYRVNIKVIKWFHLCFDCRRVWRIQWV